MRRTHRRVTRASRAARAAGREPPKARAKAPVRRKKPARPSAGAAEFYAAFQRLVGEVFRINGRLLDVAGALGSDLEVTPTHWQIVAIIRNQPMTIPAISRRVGLRRQSVQHNVAQLLARGFVEQASNPDHRRASLVRLSPAGHALMQALLARQARLTEAFTAGLGLTTADVDAIGRQLKRMRERAEDGDAAAG